MDPNSGCAQGAKDLVCIGFTDLAKQPFIVSNHESREYHRVARANAEAYLKTSKKPVSPNAFYKKDVLKAVSENIEILARQGLPFRTSTCNLNNKLEITDGHELFTRDD